MLSLLIPALLYDEHNVKWGSLSTLHGIIFAGQSKAEVVALVTIHTEQF
jgi:hypothetical protein